MMRELFRAAFVIARRDFSAVILSKTFIFFLLGPLFPLLIGGLFGSVGDRMATDNLRPVVGIAMDDAGRKAVIQAHDVLVDQIGDQLLPDMRDVGQARDAQAVDAVLARDKDGVLAVLSGSLDTPQLTGRAGDMARVKGEMSLIIARAREGGAGTPPVIATRTVIESRAADQQGQLVTGRMAQILLFLLIILLAGMVLSNMVEEKTNKILEILAAAVPIDAVFIGKLMAMLAMSLTGIAVWGVCALIGIFALSGGQGFSTPPPAVGWPLFVALGVIYFSTAYVLLGALFIGIGSQANTVREVQTINMPVTMGQMLVFVFATYASAKIGQPTELAAAIFPFSSPFTMISRAAQSPLIWPHVVAILWQLLWVAIIVRIGVRLFRRTVLKSGSPPKAKRNGRNKDVPASV